jgi:hypothetical protein
MALILIRAVAFRRLSHVSDWWVSNYAALANLVKPRTFAPTYDPSRSATVNSEYISFEAFNDYDNAQGTILDSRR